MKRMLSILMAALLMVTVFASCSKQEAGQPGKGSFDADNDIMVVSREDGSGTRGAFVELFGVEQKDEQGNQVDMTTLEATIANSTSVVMTTVAGNPYAIGYISLGSLDETVKALKIDGVEASVQNVKDGSYQIARPFNIAVKKEGVSEAAQDFINFIMSAEGQKVVGENNCIPAADDAKAYAGNAPAGKIVIAGSSSVSPVMEKLVEAYGAVNPNAEIELQTNDSSTGMSYAMDGVCDIGMASRELKDSELAALTPSVIALDGIAVVVNNENTLEDLSAEAVKGIYTGEFFSWADVAK